MDLIGGYGSGSESDDGEQQHEQPQHQARAAPLPAAPAAGHAAAASKASAWPATASLRAPAAVTAAPAPHGHPSDDNDEQEDGAQEKPRLVAPKGPVLGQDAEPDPYQVGPARPAVTKVTDEREIPGVAHAEVWSKLPTPRAAPASAAAAVRRVVQLKLPINKALLAASLADSDSDDDAGAGRSGGAKKRLKKGAGGAGKASSQLLDLLPKPKNVVGGGGEGEEGGVVFGAGGGRIDLTGASGSGASGRGRAALGGGYDSDDEDPMARLGPMPEAGAYNAGPVEDDLPDQDDPQQPPYGYAQHQQDAQQLQQGDGAWASASAYYVGEDEQQQQQQQYWGAEEGGGGAEGGADGSALFDQALAEEQQRAAKKGQALDLSGIQFKEVNARDLTYSTTAARDSQRGLQAALGSEYAASLRAQAKPYEGDKMSKRKHQIGTLFYNAKMRELDIMEGKAAGLNAKQAAKRKYGW